MEDIATISDDDERTLTRMHHLSRRATERLAGLTARETDVLLLLAEGASNKLAARSLGISPRTVEIHRANMMARLGVENIVQAAKIVFWANLFKALAEDFQVH